MPSAVDSSDPAFSRRSFRSVELDTSRHVTLGPIEARACGHHHGPLGEHFAVSGAQTVGAQALGTPSPARSSLIPGLDRLGIWLSAGCAVHCAVTPVLLLVAPVLGSALFENTLRLVLVSLGVGAVLWGIVSHRSLRALPWLLAAVALFVWLVLHHETPHEALLSVFASTLLIGAHWTNLRVARH
jgi:MerC mercury resistance protein